MRAGSVARRSRHGSAAVRSPVAICAHDSGMLGGSTAILLKPQRAANRRASRDESVRGGHSLRRRSRR